MPRKYKRKRNAIKYRKTYVPSTTMNLRRRGVYGYRALNSIVGSKVHRFKRMCLVPGFNTSTITTGVSPGSGALTWTVAKNAIGTFSSQFALSDTVNNGELTALFDQYIIHCVVVTLACRANFADINQPLAPLPYIIYARDYDDNGLSTEADLMQYDTAKKFYFGSRRALNIKVYPRFNLLGNDGVTNYGVQLRTNTTPWLDCAVPTIKHFGLKGVIVNTAAATGPDITFDVSAKYYMSFKVQR